MSIGPYNIGSFGADILAEIPNVPSSLSGAQIEKIVFRKIQFVNEKTGYLLGSTDIGVRFHEAIMNLSCADVLKKMAIDVNSASSVSLGDLTISNNDSSRATKAAERYDELGMSALNEIGRKGLTYQTFYG